MARISFDENNSRPNHFESDGVAHDGKNARTHTHTTHTQLDYTHATTPVIRPRRRLHSFRKQKANAKLTTVHAVIDRSVDGRRHALTYASERLEPLFNRTLDAAIVLVRSRVMHERSNDRSLNRRARIHPPPPPPRTPPWRRRRGRRRRPQVRRRRRTHPGWQSSPCTSSPARTCTRSPARSRGSS